MPGPLSADHFRAIADARLRSKKIMRAAAVAVFNGWTLAIFAVLTAVMVLFGDWTAGVLAAILGIFAAIELRGAAMFRRYDVAAARMLGFNQLALGLAIFVYAAWSYSHSAVTETTQTGDPQMDEMLRNIASDPAFKNAEHIARVALYGSMALIGPLLPGLNAWYYFSRGTVVRKLLATTPPWVIDALKAAA